MAYIRQEDKKKLAPKIKAVLKKYGVKGSISIRHNSTLIVTLKEGALDLVGEENAARKRRAERNWDKFHPVQSDFQISPEYQNDRSPFFNELADAMKGDKWYENSDVMNDYYDTGYYMEISVGKYNKPYQYTGEPYNNEPASSGA